MNTALPTSVAGLSAVLILVGALMIGFGHGHGKPFPLLMILFGGMGLAGGVVASIVNRLTSAAGHALDGLTSKFLGYGFGGLALTLILVFFLWKHLHPKHGKGAPNGVGKWPMAFAVLAAGMIIGSAVPQIHQLFETSVTTAGDTTTAIMKG